MKDKIIKAILDCCGTSPGVSNAANQILDLLKPDIELSRECTKCFGNGYDAEYPEYDPEVDDVPLCPNKDCKDGRITRQMSYEEMVEHYKKVIEVMQAMFEIAGDGMSRNQLMVLLTFTDADKIEWQVSIG